jgi:NAD(P)-dependent dehydrogenase (short-subunit alcohol dehydrogenase family)
MVASHFGANEEAHVRLQDRVAIVTGGARGIGEGIARQLAADGAKVVVVDLDLPQAEKTAAQIGGGAIARCVDMCEEAQVMELARDVAAQCGGIDIIVNNAGAGRAPWDPDAVYEVTSPLYMEQPLWDDQLAQNLRTAFLGTKAVAPYLQKRGAGAIVNIASIAGLIAAPGLPAYAAAKAGVISFTRSSALELAPQNIRVNAICPGFLWTRSWEGNATRMSKVVPEFAGMSAREVFLTIVKRGVPMGREQTPDDIGRLAAFICSDDAQNITGQAISVDGGITLR